MIYPLNYGDYNPHNRHCQDGGAKMISFDKLWKLMELRKISTYKLREQCGFDNKTIRRLKANENTETKTLNKICTFLDCPIEDIIEYIPD